MGMIEKQIRKHANQRLAESMVTVTPLSNSQVIDAVRKICWDHNVEFNRQFLAKEALRTRPRGRFNRAPGPELSHYYVEVNPTAILVSYSRPPQWIAAQAGRKNGPLAGWWLASVRFPNFGSPTPPGYLSVELTLLRWVMNSNTGKLQNRDKYEWFADRLAEVLRPGFVSPPV